jgi:hypothetical protein
VIFLNNFSSPLRGLSFELVCPFVQVQFLFLSSSPSCGSRIFGVGVGAGTQAESILSVGCREITELQTTSSALANWYKANACVGENFGV